MLLPRLYLVSPIWGGGGGGEVTPASRIPLSIVKFFTKIFTYEHKILIFIMVNETCIHEYEMLTYKYVIQRFPKQYLFPLLGFLWAT